MAGLHVCLDESGKAHGSWVVMCGWASTVPRWEAFAEEWFVFMKQENISSVHASALMSKRRRYQGIEMGRGKRLEILTKALEITRKYALVAVLVGVDCSAFKSMSNLSRKKCGGDPHVFCFREVIRLIAAFLEECEKQFREPSDCSLIFDDNEEYAARCYRLLIREKNQNLTWRKRLRSISFCEDESYPPIQAADILSWLVRSWKDISDKRVGEPALSSNKIRQLIEWGTQGLHRPNLIYGADALKSINRYLVDGYRIDQLYPIRFYEEKKDRHV